MSGIRAGTGTSRPTSSGLRQMVRGVQWHFYGVPVANPGKEELIRWIQARPYRGAAQLDRFSVFGGHQLVMLESVASSVPIYRRPYLQQTIRWIPPWQRVPYETCTLDRIPLLQKTHYRSAGRRICPLFSWA